ncbi:MAG: WecB/TagA/CpsF family glycosyltransferase [Cyclobacteriaceae bacterium]
MNIDKAKFFDIPLIILDSKGYNCLISDQILEKKKLVLFSENLHSLYLQFYNKDFHDVKRTYATRIDGMPIVWLAKILGNPEVTRDHRLTWMDWKDTFFDNCNSKGHRLFYVGSKPEYSSKIKDYIGANFENIQFECRHGYFTIESHEEEALIQTINEFRPDIVLVGMGMPRQEFWVHSNYERIDASVFLTCGAAMEYLIGEVNIPPRWMGRVGLEWLYRFWESPGRFYKRYFFEPWVLMYHIVKYKLRR